MNIDFSYEKLAPFFLVTANLELERRKHWISIHQPLDLYLVLGEITLACCVMNRFVHQKKQENALK